VCQEFVNHASLLKKGVCLLSAPSVSDALTGNLPLCESSSERAFLTDFINCAPRTSGARLATSVSADLSISSSCCHCRAASLPPWDDSLSVKAPDLRSSGCGFDQ